MKPCPDTFPFPLVALDETASTNQYLSQLCNQLQESVAELTTVTAEFQTAGKGQRGNTWEAEEGKNLLFSFVLYPSFLEARRQFILSQIVSLAIKEELSRWSDEITIKCPKCGKDVILKKTKKGRMFYGCEGYPECDFVSWQKPSDKKCPKCGGYMIEKGSKLVCADETCGYVESKNDKEQ